MSLASFLATVGLLLAQLWPNPGPGRASTAEPPEPFYANSFESGSGTGCTANDVPYNPCCSGAGTGSCVCANDGNEFCVATNDPYECCEGSGTGHCQQDSVDGVAGDSATANADCDYASDASDGSESFNDPTAGALDYVQWDHLFDAARSEIWVKFDFKAVDETTATTADFLRMRTGTPGHAYARLMALSSVVNNGIDIYCGTGQGRTYLNVYDETGPVWCSYKVHWKQSDGTGTLYCDCPGGTAANCNGMGTPATNGSGPCNGTDGGGGETWEGFEIQATSTGSHAKRLDNLRFYDANPD